jgi:polar amino acid transport system ATP-binding protein
MIRIENLCKSFGGHEVLQNVNAHVDKGECVSIIGRSGTGKSVLLSCLNALLVPDSGKVFIDGVDIYDKKTDINKARASMGMVYQNFNLFSHLSALENIILAPVKVQKQPREAAVAKARELLASVSLGSKENAFPHELSGGQKQRIAIVRAMAMDPKIVLFDEPTSALDPAMAGEVLAVIRSFAKEGLTMLIVTHEMNFANEISDRVFYMDEKGIYESGTPKDIFDDPQRERTRAFVSRLRTLELEIQSADFDLLAYQGRIQFFCEKYAIEKKGINRAQMVFEELSMYLLKNRFVSGESPGILVNVGYAEKEKQLVITLRYNGASQDPFAGAGQADEEMGLVMIQRMSKSVEYSAENGKNTITVRL